MKNQRKTVLQFFFNNYGWSEHFLLLAQQPAILVLIEICDFYPASTIDHFSINFRSSTFSIIMLTRYIFDFKLKKNSHSLKKGKKLALIKTFQKIPSTGTEP